MAQSYLLELLQNLSKQEVASLDGWLQMEQRGQGTRPVVLFGLWREAGWQIDEDQWLWEQMYPGEAFGKRSLRELRKVRNRLAEKVERFLAWQEFQREEEEMKLYLCRALNRRGAARAYLRKHRSLLKQLEEPKNQSPQTSFRRFQLLSDYQGFLETQKQVTPQELCQRLVDDLDSWWVQEKMLYMNLYLGLNKNRQQARPVQGLWEQEVREVAEKWARERDQPVLQAHALFQRLLLQDDEATAKESWQFLQADHQGLKEEKNHLFNLLINYYMKLFNSQNSPALAQKVLELYDWGLQDPERMMPGGRLPIGHFRIIIRLSLGQGKPELAEQYLEQLVPYLPENQQAAEEAAARVQLAEVRGDYLKVLQWVQENRFTPGNEEIKARFSQIRALYERNALDKEGLMGRLRSLKTYIKAQKRLSPGLREAHLQRVRLFQKMLRCETPSQWRRFAKNLTVKISHPHILWMKEKAEEERM
jgi:hypothetical protein